MCIRDSYYSDLGAHNPVRIELPSGTYVPEFHLVSAPVPAPAEQPAAAVPMAAAARAADPVITPLRAGLALAVLAAAVLVVWLVTRPAVTPLDEFWAPVLNGLTPVQLLSLIHISTAWPMSAPMMRCGWCPRCAST